MTLNEISDYALVVAFRERPTYIYLYEGDIFCILDVTVTYGILLSLVQDIPRWWVDGHNGEVLIY